MSVSLQPRGTIYIRAVIAMALARGNPETAAAIAESTWGPVGAAPILKAEVSGGASVDGAWGSVLGNSTAADEFFSLVRQQSIVGRMAGLRRTPLRVRAINVEGGAVAHFVGEGKAAPLAHMSFAARTLEPRKIAALIVISDELLESSDPAAESLIRQDLIRATIEAYDTAFIDPANAGVAGEMPASVTNGAVEVASTVDPVTDLAALIGAFDGDLQNAYLIMHPQTATEVALWRDTDSSFAFPDLGPRGGSVLGIPVLCSRSVPRDSSGSTISLIDASGIALGEGSSQLKTSHAAAIEMTDTPAGDSVTPTGSQYVSLFQANALALLQLTEVNWQAVRAGSVASLTGVDYGVNG